MKKMIIDLKLLVAAVTVGLVLGNESCGSLKSNKVLDTIKEEEVGVELAEVVIAEGTEIIKENELSENMTNAVNKYEGEFTKLSNAASSLDFSNVKAQFRKPIRKELPNIEVSIEAVLDTAEAKASPQKR